MLSFGLPRPQQILACNFAVTEAEATENQGPIKKMDNEASGTSEGGRDREIGRQVANGLAEELVRGLHDLGFAVERRPTLQVVTNNPC